LWYGLGHGDRVPWAVEHKVNIVGNLGGKGMRGLTDRYRQEWVAQGNKPEDMPFMGVGRHIVVAETDKEALEIAQRGYHKWRESFLMLWRKHNVSLPNPNALFPERFEDAEAEGRAVAGTPEKVRDFLQRTIDEGGLNYLLCRFAFGDITGEEALNSIDMFSRRVMADIRPCPLDA
jgi:alkanesulfonate monooxygenase SsuD/methylene tetrahydromethanopterin reductase-like flavin-dependent oxidoreductase (luciferase family)